MSLKNSREGEQRSQIIRDYGRYLEVNPLEIGEIRDVSVLPYDKDEILDASLLEIIVEENSQQLQALKAGAILLAGFQENVGSKPLRILGVSHSELSKLVRDGTAIEKLATKMENPDRSRYKSFLRVVRAERLDIEQKILAAEYIWQQMPEEKKREILG